MTRAQITAFLDDIEAAQRKHGISIGHEDAQGGFLLVPFDEDVLRWVRGAVAEGETPAEWMARVAPERGRPDLDAS